MRAPASLATPATILLLSLALSAQAQDTRDSSSFAAWRAGQEAAVSALEAHLESEGLHQVVGVHELLKSASDWKRCKAEPYAVPPAEQWPAVVSVLRLLKELVAQGVLGSFSVHSAYRAEALNACAGGAPGSAHLHAFAVDLTPHQAHDPTAKLCAFWREHGPAWSMGFSRYPSGRLHIDTSGHRTWGRDHTGKSAVCGPP